MSNLKVKIFEMWLEQNHPGYTLTFGILTILLFFIFVTSVIFVFWFNWWWKMSLVTIVLFLLTKVIQRVFLGVYVEEYNQK